MSKKEQGEMLGQEEEDGAIVFQNQLKIGGVQLCSNNLYMEEMIKFAKEIIRDKDIKSYLLMLEKKKAQIGYTG